MPEKDGESGAAAAIERTEATEQCGELCTAVRTAGPTTIVGSSVIVAGPHSGASVVCDEDATSRAAGVVTRRDPFERSTHATF